MKLHFHVVPAKVAQTHTRCQLLSKNVEVHPDLKTTELVFLKQGPFLLTEDLSLLSLQQPLSVFI